MQWWTAIMLGKYKYSCETPAVYNTPRHICSVCQRSRSSTYHARHPIRPGDLPTKQGICSRCVRRGWLEDVEERQPSAITVYEIHHHYVQCTCKTGNGLSVSPVEIMSQERHVSCIELDAGEESDRKGLSLQFRDNLPPTVRFWNKPRGFKWNHTCWDA